MHQFVSDVVPIPAASQWRTQDQRTGIGREFQMPRPGEVMEHTSIRGRVRGGTEERMTINHERLRELELKPTVQRDDIALIFFKLGDHLNVEELYADVRRLSPRVGHNLSHGRAGTGATVSKRAGDRSTGSLVGRTDRFLTRGFRNHPFRASNAAGPTSALDSFAHRIGPTRSPPD